MGAAIFCCFFATMDDPVRGINAFLVMTLWSLPVSAFYVLGVVPLVHDFGMLALCIAPFLLVVGCYMARPASAAAALAMFFGVAGTLALHDTANADLVTFTNLNLAQAFGAVVAARVTALMRSVGAEWSADRIRRATWRDLSKLAVHPQGQGAHDAYAGRMLDRIALLAPRLAPGNGEDTRVAVQQALSELRLGADIVALQQQRGHLPVDTARHLFRGISHTLRDKLLGAAVYRSSLLPLIDGLLLDALQDGTGSAAVAALVGLRRNLFPAAPAKLQP